MTGEQMLVRLAVRQHVAQAVHVLSNVDASDHAAVLDAAVQALRYCQSALRTLDDPVVSVTYDAGRGERP